MESVTHKTVGEWEGPAGKMGGAGAVACPCPRGASERGRPARLGGARRPRHWHEPAADAAMCVRRQWAVAWCAS
eukprot:646030-Pleurochrysis_carterae.AAC.1